MHIAGRAFGGRTMILHALIVARALPYARSTYVDRQTRASAALHLRRGLAADRHIGPAVDRVDADGHFPSINIPVISVIWSYGGLSATEMQERITTVVERAMTTTVSNIEHLESESVRGNSVIKLYFQPGADVNAAIAQVTAICQTLLRPLPSTSKSILVRPNLSMTER